MSLARFARALRLTYLTARALVHTMAAGRRPGMWCSRCRSTLVIAPSGAVFVEYHALGGACPVHVAWCELNRASR